MGSHWKSVLARTRGWVPNIAVIAVLLGIGWWGHSYHWTLPGLSAHASEEVPVVAVVASTADEAPLAAPKKPLANSKDLPSIEFNSSQAAENCGVGTGLAEQRSTDDVVTANGVVHYDPTRLAQLAVRAPGIVWKVEKRTGDYVNRGDCMVIVDSADVGDAKANLLEAAAVFRLKQQDLERLQKLDGIIPKRELREAEAAKEVARAKLFNSHQKLVNLGFALDLDQIVNLSVVELSDRLHLLGLPQSIADETDSANLIPLTAPLTGVVTHCELVYGETVEPYKVHYIVADTSHMAIDLDVRQEDSTKLRMGATVEFQGERDSQAVTGKLTWIGTEIDPRTRTVQARVSVVNPVIEGEETAAHPRHLLKANEFGTARILVARNPSMVVVPTAAVHWQWEIEQHVVFVPSESGKTFTPRVVRAGQTSGQHVEVLAGLNAGDRIVTAGSRILSSELSDRLQQRIGDNSQAIRNFDGAARTAPTTAAGGAPST